MLSISPNSRIPVHSALCANCGSRRVDLVMADNDQCLAEMILQDVTRQICFGNSKYGLRGYLCKHCGHRQTISDWKELAQCAWYEMVGDLNFGFIGAFKLLQGHKVLENGFTTDQDNTWFVFNGSSGCNTVEPGNTVNGVYYP